MTKKPQSRSGPLSRRPSKTTLPYAKTKLPPPPSGPKRHTTVPSVYTPRETRRPTVSIPQLDQHRIQEAILGVFKRYQYSGIDMEALIYFTLQAFDVSPLNYESIHKAIKIHIMKNFAIQQGSHLRLGEVEMRRLIVCYTIEKSKE